MFSAKKRGKHYNKKLLLQITIGCRHFIHQNCTTIPLVSSLLNLIFFNVYFYRLCEIPVNKKNYYYCYYYYDDDDDDDDDDVSP